MRACGVGKPASASQPAHSSSLLNSSGDLLIIILPPFLSISLPLYLKGEKGKTKRFFKRVKRDLNPISSNLNQASDSVIAGSKSARQQLKIYHAREVAAAAAAHSKPASQSVRKRGIQRN